jgi:predicted anti-sigma-YlaC factor YlaD
LLAGIGCAQLLLGLAQMTLAPTDGHDHVDAAAGGVLGTAHLSHESAAWNIALGAGFLWIAARRVRPAGLMLVLTAFVGVLTLLSLNDLVTGRVQTERLATHGFVAAGYLIVLALTSRRLSPGDPPAGQTSRPRWHVQFDPPATPTPTRLRVVSRRLTASDRRHAA